AATRSASILNELPKCHALRVVDDCLRSGAEFLLQRERERHRVSGAWFGPFENLRPPRVRAQVGNPFTNQVCNESGAMHRELLLLRRLPSSRIQAPGPPGLEEPHQASPRCRIFGKGSPCLRCHNDNEGKVSWSA